MTRGPVLNRRTRMTEDTTVVCPTQSLLLPVGLLDDLEKAIIQADRDFLTEVARTLGLPVAEVLGKCLGRGGRPTKIPVLWGPPKLDEEDEGEGEEDEEGESKHKKDGKANWLCPWMDCKGKGLWTACQRMRLTPTLACAVHVHARTSDTTRLATDPIVRAVPVATPIQWRGRLYWANLATTTVFREDGTLEPTLRFRYRTTADGQQELVVESVK